MAVSLKDLLRDLEDETAIVDAHIISLSNEQWNLDTPANGWTISDQVSHLAYFDQAATLAATDPDRFAVEAEQLMEHGTNFSEYIAHIHRTLGPNQLLDWFHRSRSGLHAAFLDLDPSIRLPWYGPPMSAASSVTARLMETWAHGTDILDTLGTSTKPSPRLRHIAHLGVRTFNFSFDVHGLEVPHTQLFVELTASDGTIWRWGDPSSTERVRGTALDFCLVVTQRRNRADTNLVAEGALADQWLGIAQAFAGPPGDGRESRSTGGVPGSSPDSSETP
jgi:uncharacterized protein (TIGR03084 family)